MNVSLLDPGTRQSRPPSRRYLFAEHGVSSRRIWYLGYPFAEENRSDPARNRRRNNKSPYTVSQPNRFDLHKFTNVERLHSVFRILEAEGGPAPGMDGLTYGDFSGSEVYGALRVIREAILDGIGGDVMESAIVLAKWFKGEAVRVRGILAGRPAEDLRLVEWIASKGGAVTAREVQQGCRWIETAEQAASALSALAKAERGRWVDRPPGPKGGRPTRVFQLNTLSTSTQPP